MSPFQPHRDGTVIDLLVQPRASRSEIAGIHDGALRVRIAAPPVDGAANAAIIDFLSKQLKVRKSDIEIASGATGRRKRVLIHGVEPETVRQIFA
jgi:uncharacterized protein (TIGR00251 family)